MPFSDYLGVRPYFPFFHTRDSIARAWASRPSIRANAAIFSAFLTEGRFTVHDDA